MKKKVIAGFLAVVLAMGTFAGCGGTDGKTNENSGKKAENSKDTSGKKEKVVFWYSHTSEEGKAFEEAIQAFNESQDKYEVEGLSAMDKQKIIVALSGSDAPDVVEVTNQDIISYAKSGLIESVSDLAKEDGYDANSIFAKQALESNTIDDTLYALPFAAQIIQMFYNKDILKEIGYSEPPKTMEELYEMAEKATQVDESGNITRLGYPLFPLASARQELVYSFGGKWWSDDGKTLTPDDPLILDSLNMNMKFREKYGIEKVQAFVASANTNRYTENDMFFAGKQLFRFDGPWLATMAADWGPDVNYDVALTPGTEENPDLQGTSRYETNSLAIPVVANNKEGAWEFAKFFTDSDSTKETLMAIGNLPTKLDLYDDKDMLAMQNYDVFIEALKKENGIQYPKIADLAKYTSLIDEYLDYVYNGIKTPEDAMKELTEQTKLLEE
ncbi:extracellular solute-binding protein [Blautia liquoris]|jgi:multiple sugar transport system substrate-binding protein|uniref:Extracellular solute-binding protein n=1 Tax=Blautia liquoris TaxID=2779518 RepID=A0A7M2RH72_9FIRM|nr:ABC transporter substrate-binding protein [Blautia liquoris]QOV18722.1 extracellular solute-binding protein [Blautia liquoris]